VNLVVQGANLEEPKTREAFLLKYIEIWSGLRFESPNEAGALFRIS